MELTTFCTFILLYDCQNVKKFKPLNSYPNPFQYTFLLSAHPIPEVILCIATCPLCFSEAPAHILTLYLCRSGCSFCSTRNIPISALRRSCTMLQIFWKRKKSCKSRIFNKNSEFAVLLFKADNGTRTRDLRITNATLYHLSYISQSFTTDDYCSTGKFYLSTIL